MLQLNIFLQISLLILSGFNVIFQGKHSLIWFVICVTNVLILVLGNEMEIRVKIFQITVLSVQIVCIMGFFVNIVNVCLVVWKIVGQFTIHGK